MKALDLVENNYPRHRKEERIKTILDSMYKNRVDRVLVLRDSETLYGIATEWDIFHKLSTIKKVPDQPYDLPLASVATYPVDTLPPETPVKTIINQFLLKEYSSIPILDENQIYGLVTKRGVISAHLDKIRRIDKEVIEITVKAKGRIEPFKSLRNAENKLRLGGYSTLIVHEDGRYIGVVTALDIAKEILKIRKTYPKKDWDNQISKLHVADVMRRDYATLSPTDPVYRAAEIMVERNQKIIPIVEGDKLIGIVTRRHVLNLIKE